MKLINNLLAITIVLFAFSCTAPENEESGYEISISIKDAPDSTKVTLYHRTDNGTEHTDSVYLINAKAKMTGNLEGFPEMYYLKFDGYRGTIRFFLENDKINVNGQIDSLWYATTNGSKLNDIFTAYIEEQKLVWDEMDTLYKTKKVLEMPQDSAKLEAINNQLDEQEKKLEEINKKYIGNNTDNILGAYIANRMYYSDEYTAALDSVLSLFDPAIAESKYVNSIKTKLEKWRKLEIGMIAPDFTQADSLGNPVSLSSFRGKYMLIDFWASWCGPCLRENPNIVAAYQKYHDKGFDILGVSLDNNREKWIKETFKGNLTWNHVSDLKGWKNEVSKSYGVQAIPYSILIDPEGKIIGKNLRGEALHEALAAVLD